MDEVTQPSRHNVDIRKNSRDTGSRHGGYDLHTQLCLSSVYSGPVFSSHTIDIGPFPSRGLGCNSDSNPWCAGESNLRNLRGFLEKFFVTLVKISRIPERKNQALKPDF